ncbi:hypothetical protein LCGC14_2520130 [marine sediment metagenome]|uniref:Homing endonuclease LAGLIDADG domain-containing protein n=1 Tax=marine sediment metagenome TaxID=412755 RepID=A0A0F9BJL7_9ZZZZ
MIEVKEVAWLAGLLEGEGYFGLNNGKYPVIKLGMCDEDVVTRAAVLMKSRVRRRKNMYITQVDGVHAIEWMMTLYVFFGKRRREVVASVIKFWKSYTFSRARTTTRCHPDRSVHAFEMCRPCYDIEYKKRRLLERQAQWKLCH